VPLYEVRVLAPADQPGGPRRVHAETKAGPTAKWFRPKVNDPAPTLEVTAK
jgi:hypothetical protein